MSDLDRFIHFGVIHSKLVPILDQFAQGLASSFLSGRQEDARTRRGKPTAPGQGDAWPGVAAQAAESVYRRTNGNLLAEDGDRVLAVHDHSAQGAMPLVAHKQHGRASEG